MWEGLDRGYIGSWKIRKSLSHYILKIDGIFKLSDDFFQLDDEAKQAYARPASGSGHGWVAFEREKY